MFLYVWCVLYYKFLFLMSLSDSVSFSVYMKNLGKCPRSVNNFRTKYLFVIVCDLGGPKSSLPGEI